MAEALAPRLGKPIPRRTERTMASRDYQVVEEITWSDEYLKANKEKHATLKQSYKLYGKAVSEAEKHGLNRMVEAKTTKVIYKPTGEVLWEKAW